MTAKLIPIPPFCSPVIFRKVIEAFPLVPSGCEIATPGLARGNFTPLVKLGIHISQSLDDAGFLIRLILQINCFMRTDIVALDAHRSLKPGWAMPTLQMFTMGRWFVSPGWAMPTVIFARVGAGPPYPPRAGAPAPLSSKRDGCLNSEEAINAKREREMPTWAKIELSTFAEKLNLFYLRCMKLRIQYIDRTLSLHGVEISKLHVAVTY